MSKRTLPYILILMLAIWALSACTGSIENSTQKETSIQNTNTGNTHLQVLATQSFLADIAQNVAGDRLSVGTLIPLGTDPHSFEATPQDLARISEAQVLIENGGGLEEWLQELLKNAGGKREVIVASAGLEPASTGDPHFWLDPLLVVQYAENIRSGFTSVDPAGSQTYQENASSYIARLQDLDAWIRSQVAQIPAEQRLLVTNHEEFGYFADRYGFTVVGTLIPATSSSAAQSAKDLARLVDTIRASGAKAIFLEAGTNPQLAEQVSRETGMKVITNLYSHTLTAPDGAAPDYISMMRHNVTTIVEALR